MRGRGNSGGDFSGFATEAPDGDDALAGSKRTCFVMAGWAATASATKGSPNCWAATQLAPDALAPAMCGLDERLHWASEAGRTGGSLTDLGVAVGRRKPPAPR